MAQSLDDAQVYTPWSPSLSKKQFEILNCRKRVILVSGPRRTGKSIAVGHKVCRHLYDVDRARVGVFVTSYKVGTHGGSWADLVDICLPEWIKAELPTDDGQDQMRYTSTDPATGKPGPKLDAKTRTPFFTVVNRHGTESHCTLYSIDNPNEIEQKVKQLRLSMVWVVELSTFDSPEIFKLTEEQLRWGPYEDQQWISDTNPSEEGTNSWIYKTFWERRNKPVDDLTPEEKIVLPNIAVYEVYLEDNTFLREEEIASLKWKYADDPDGFARHVEGRWIRASTVRGYVFADVLNEHVHVCKDSIDVDRNTVLLYTGWDPGIIHSAAVIVEKRMIHDHAFWFVLDELVSTDEKVPVADFAVQFFEKILELQKFYQKTWDGFTEFEWKHWSDPNVSTLNHPSLTGAVSAEILKVTGGQIELDAAIKGAGSVESGCNLIRRLLREERLFIGENCPHLLETFRKIKRCMNRTDFIDRNDPLKHVLDALRYCLMMESIEELDDVPRPKSTARRMIHVA